MVANKYGLAPVTRESQCLINMANKYVILTWHDFKKVYHDVDISTGYFNFKSPS